MDLVLGCSILQWLGSGSKPICPNCRQPVVFHSATVPDVIFLPDGLLWVPSSAPTTLSLTIPDAIPEKPLSAITPPNTNLNHALSFLHRDVSSKQALIDEMHDEIESLKCDLEDAVSDRDHILNDLEHLKSGQHVIKALKEASRQEVAGLQSSLDEAVRENHTLSDHVARLESTQTALTSQITRLVSTIGELKLEAQGHLRKLSAYTTLGSIGPAQDVCSDKEWQGKIEEIISIDNVADLRDILIEYHRKIQVFHESSHTFKLRAYEMREERDRARKELQSIRAKSANQEAQIQLAKLETKGPRTRLSQELEDQLLSTNTGTKKGLDTAAIEAPQPGDRVGEIQSLPPQCKQGGNAFERALGTDLSDTESNSSMHTENVQVKATHIAHSAEKVDEIYRPGSMVGTKRVGSRQFDPVLEGLKRGSNSQDRQCRRPAPSGSGTPTSTCRIPDGMGGSRRQTQRDILSMQDHPAHVANTTSFNATSRHRGSVFGSVNTKQPSPTASALSGQSKASSSRSHHATLLNYFSRK
ncbi:hypothetical protein BASA50_000495 [Batrachochytrium salamandrivorans]|uniref:Uncharacterized protein n=1 Tax=Batrachochytrium salamandrivorans TaxID=1357716 RepID=A0ABQ8EU02_9FUNG|nr:hypothetical protein BASA50_000495 [Batrachochytrium salamandrivorans]